MDLNSKQTVLDRNLNGNSIDTGMNHFDKERRIRDGLKESKISKDQVGLYMSEENKEEGIFGRHVTSNTITSKNTIPTPSNTNKTQNKMVEHTRHIEKVIDVIDVEVTGNDIVMNNCNDIVMSYCNDILKEKGRGRGRELKEKGREDGRDLREEHSGEEFEDTSTDINTNTSTTGTNSREEAVSPEDTFRVGSYEEKYHVLSDALMDDTLSDVLSDDTSNEGCLSGSVFNVFGVFEEDNRNSVSSTDTRTGNNGTDTRIGNNGIGNNGTGNNGTGNNGTGNNGTGNNGTGNNASSLLVNDSTYPSNSSSSVTTSVDSSLANTHTTHTNTNTNTNTIDTNTTDTTNTISLPTTSLPNTIGVTTINLPTTNSITSNCLLPIALRNNSKVIVALSKPVFPLEDVVGFDTQIDHRVLVNRGNRVQVDTGHGSEELSKYSKDGDKYGYSTYDESTYDQCSTYDKSKYGSDKQSKYDKCSTYDKSTFDQCSKDDSDRQSNKQSKYRLGYYYYQYLKDPRYLRNPRYLRDSRLFAYSTTDVDNDVNNDVNNHSYTSTSYSSHTPSPSSTPHLSDSIPSRSIPSRSRPHLPHSIPSGLYTNTSTPHLPPSMSSTPHLPHSSYIQTSHTDVYTCICYSNTHTNGVSSINMTCATHINDFSSINMTCVSDEPHMHANGKGSVRSSKSSRRNRNRWHNTSGGLCSGWIGDRMLKDKQQLRSTCVSDRDRDRDSDRDRDRDIGRHLVVDNVVSDANDINISRDSSSTSTFRDSLNLNTSKDSLNLSTSGDTSALRDTGTSSSTSYRHSDNIDFNIQQRDYHLRLLKSLNAPHSLKSTVPESTVPDSQKSLESLKSTGPHSLKTLESTHSQRPNTCRPNTCSTRVFNKQQHRKRDKETDRRTGITMERDKSRDKMLSGTGIGGSEVGGSGMGSGYSMGSGFGIELGDKSLFHVVSDTIDNTIDTTCRDNNRDNERDNNVTGLKHRSSRNIDNKSIDSRNNDSGSIGKDRYRRRNNEPEWDRTEDIISNEKERSKESEERGRESEERGKGIDLTRTLFSPMPVQTQPDTPHGIHKKNITQII